MNVKSKTIWRASGVALALLAAPCALAQAGEAPAEAAPAAEENKVDEALQTEIRYVEALIDCGFPDFAEPVIAATKKKWPESEAMFFAIEIRGLLSLQKFDEAQAKIAALPDRKGSKYWAARLEVANNFFARGNKAECSKIYDEFFKTFSDFNKLPKELKEFYRNACYAWGQILVGDKRFDEAVKVYANLLKLINKRGSDEEAATWCNVACETAEMYLHLANGKPDPKSRAPFLDPAKKIVDQLLWEQGQPVYFGRAIAMKANIELLKGDVAKAQGTIDDYMDQLADLHEQLAAADPDGRLGALRLSPMPLCRYMLADMLWKEAQDEAKKPKRDDERVKALLFGEKLKSGKRNGAGAFNHALNVFVKYPERRPTMPRSRRTSRPSRWRRFARCSSRARARSSPRATTRARSRTTSTCFRASPRSRSRSAPSSASSTRTSGSSSARRGRPTSWRPGAWTRTPSRATSPSGSRATRTARS